VVASAAAIAAIRLTGFMECRRDDDGLFRLDVGSPDHLGPLLGFVGDERADKGRASQVGKPRLDLGIGEPGRISRVR